MKHLNRFLTILIFIFLYLPLFVMMFFSFNESSSTAVFTGFSIKWYIELINDSETISAVSNTLVLAIVSSVISTVLGVMAAVGICYMKSKIAKSSIMSVTNIPMMSPEIVTGISMMLLFVFVGKLVGSATYLSFWTLLIAHVTFCLPYVILNVLPKLKQVGPSLTEAAEDLGCTPLKAFFKAVLPAISSGITAGFIMAFTLSLDDFVISYFTSGPDFQTLPIRIFSMTKKTVKPDMYALSTIIFFTIFILLLLVNISQANASNNKTSKGLGKKIVVAIVVIAIIVGAGTFATTQQYTYDYDALFAELEGEYSRDYAGTTLNVFNWGEYIADGSEGTLNVNEAFEKLTGIKVNYSTFDSNESLYAKLQSNAVAYDIVIPSDYMIERLKNENLLRKVDMSKITNYHYIDDKYKGLYFDPNEEYSVPYTTGMVGIIYNTKYVKEVPDSWSVLWDEKYEDEILMFNNSRDSLAIAQFMLGYDVNTQNKDEWRASAELLKKQNKVLQARVMDEIFNKMEAENAYLAPYYNGDFLTMLDENENLALAYPKEGTNIFIDSVCIPACSQNYEAALMYMNFLLDPPVALEIAEYICYSSPNTAVTENEDYSLKGDEILYPSEDVLPDNLQYYHDFDSETKLYISKLWEEIIESR